MDLELLSRDDLLEVSRLLLEGKTKEEVENILIPHQIKSTTNMLHTIACHEPHGEGFGCAYYQEIEYTEPCKAKWLAITRELLEIATIEELHNAIALASRAIMLVSNNAVGPSMQADTAQHVAWKILQLASTNRNLQTQALAPTQIYDSPAQYLIGPFGTESGSSF